jgi:hypothetical protein
VRHARIALGAIAPVAMTKKGASLNTVTREKAKPTNPSRSLHLKLCMVLDRHVALLIAGGGEKGMRPRDGGQNGMCPRNDGRGSQS